MVIGVRLVASLRRRSRPSCSRGATSSPPATASALCARSNDHGKQLANQALTNGIEISEDERATIRLAEPFAALAPTPDSTDIRWFSTSEIVETLGIYANLRGGENPALALIEDARRCRISTGKRNEKPLQERVRRLSDAEIAQLVEGYKQGDSVYALGCRFGIHRTTVSEHLKRAGVPTRGAKHQELTTEQIAEAHRLRTEGMSLARIATAVSATVSAVRREMLEE